MNVVHEINLDFVHRGLRQQIYVVQGDSDTRELQISLYELGTEWAVPEGISVLLRYKKMDGTGGMYDTMPDGTLAWRKSGNVIRWRLAPQVLSCPGQVDCQLVLMQGDACLSTFIFGIIVDHDPAYDAVTSEGYFNWSNVVGNFIVSPQAQVGQILQVKAVNSDGFPVEWEAVDDKAGELVELRTSAKDSLVAAINEIYMNSGNGPGGGGTSIYTPSLKNLLDSRVITVSEGTKVELQFSYSSVDSEGIDDGPGIGRVLVNKVTRQTFSVAQGINTMDITSYLTAGSNSVQIQAENSEGAIATLPYTVTVAAAYLSSAFDASAVFSGEIPFVYTPTGIADKTIHFELDDVEIGTAVVTTSGRQQNYTIPAQKHGSHSLRCWFECEIEGSSVQSNVLYFALICTEEGNTTPIVAVSNQLLTSVEQFSNIVTKYRVYDPTSLNAAISLEVDGEAVSNLTVDRTEQTWTYRPMAVGNLTQTIRCGDEYVSWSQAVTASKIQVEAETAALALHLSSYGRSNNEENPGVWEFENIACDFQNFNFTSDGWLQDEDDITVLRITGDARLEIPYKIFAYDFRTTGKTIEFELATREVLNYDAEVINCFSGGRGFTITAQQLLLASEESKLGTRYKEDEHIRVTFVVEKRSENRLILSYINGIMSGAAIYPEDDDFSQFEPVGITIGSNDCTTDLYNIRVYDNNLTRYQVLDNWIADTQNLQLRQARYLRNQIYDNYGRVVISQLPNDLCYLVIQCPVLPQYKGDKKTCSGYFVDLVHPERSFTFRDAEIDVQGTSSQYYWRKNYKIKFEGGFILYDGSSVTVYQMNEDAVPVSVFTMKADVASSEGYYNVVAAKLFNQYHPLTLPAQEEDPRVRYSIDGFPIVIFWDNGSETTFLGKYNFNNDKDTPEPFGLKPGDERWEVLQNGTARVGFHSADFSGDGWKEDYKGNYPDGNTDLSRLEPMCAWVTSTDTGQATGEAVEPVTYDGVEYAADTEQYRLAKFGSELGDRFHAQSCDYYDVFTELFLCMDQREKNVLWRYDSRLGLWVPDCYDADSIIGHNNQAQPVFDYWMEDIDHTPSGDPVFNGQGSTFWCNMRTTRFEELKAEYHRIREAGLSYESVMAAFAAHKEKWPEAIYNEDMQSKCLDALIQNGDGTYLPFLRGDKWAWTQWWMYNRFRYLDSKYEYGTSLENRATIRTNVMQNITATYYMNLYGHCYYNAEHIMERVERDVPVEFVSAATGAEDRVIGLNDADMITDLGDLSGHQVELIDLSKMIRLRAVKLGDGAEGYQNLSLNSITLGNNVLLRTLDARNCPNLTMAPDISGCTNIEEIYLEGSGITGLKLPDGGILKTLHLPGTVVNLTIRNQPQLADFQIPNCSQITTLNLENAGAASAMALEILAQIPANSRVRLLGCSIADTTAADVIALCDRLDTMRGLDESGNNLDKPQVSGTVYIDSLTSEELYRIQSRYPDIKVVYNELTLYTVRFYNGSTLLQTLENVAYGSAVAFAGETPIKDGETDHSRWIFTGWSLDPAFVTGDMDCYAQYRFTGSFARELVQRTIEGDYENGRIENVGDFAFYGCASITNVSVPMINKIGSHAFYGCSSLKSMHTGAVTEIPYNAFSTCHRIEAIDMPAVTKVGNSFGAMHSLRAVILRSESICVAEMGNIFATCSRFTGSYNSEYNPNGLQDGYIYVPRALLADYQAATNWSTYADRFRAIEDYPEICGGE